MSTFMNQTNSKFGYVVTIRKNLIELQIAKGTKLGKDKVTIGTLTKDEDGNVDYRLNHWQDYSELTEKFEDAAKLLKSAESLPAGEEKTKAVANAKRQLSAAEKKMLESSIHQFSHLNIADIISDISKLLTKASKNLAKVTKDGAIEFSNLVSNETFLESEAKNLVKLHNEELTRKGESTGFMDISTAREIVSHRYKDSTILLAARTVKKIKIDTFSQ